MKAYYAGVDKRGERERIVREKLDSMPLANFTVADLAILSHLQKDPINERYLVLLEKLVARKEGEKAYNKATQENCYAPAKREDIKKGLQSKVWIPGITVRTIS